MTSFASDDSRFNFVEINRNDFFEVAAAVNSGELVGAICRNFLHRERCEEVFETFTSHPEVRTRHGDAYGSYLGTFHWGKRRDDYIAECRRFSPILADISSCWNEIIKHLNTSLGMHGRTLRHATWSGDKVAAPLIRRWKGEGLYSLVPHEDLSQCSDPLQAGFEIQAVARQGCICSLNLCIANAEGGQLLIWNYVPTIEDKKKYNTLPEGGPYPADALLDKAVLEIPIRTGDLYIFNGAYIHAVGPTASARATISCLLGNVDDHQTVMWT
jgi:hypothetical protein